MKSKGKVTVYNQLLLGWSIIKKTPWLLAVAIITFIEAAVGVVWIAAILYLYVEEILNVSQSWWGWINTAFFRWLASHRSTCLPIGKLVSATTNCNGFYRLLWLDDCPCCFCWPELTIFLP